MAVMDTQNPLEAQSPKRRRAPKGEMRRMALLDAATEVFARDGYLGASMRDVADIAGITTVGLLHHFPNKVALLRALLDRRDERVVARFGDLATAPTLEGFLQFLRLSMSFSVEDARECQASVMINHRKPVGKASGFPGTRKSSTWSMGMPRRTLGHAGSGGDSQAVEVKALAKEIFSMMDGLQSNG